ncbi:MAG: hypothetical protein GC200_10595 [Tepidisphaera sp.]|nr:hypothetical protein [Tepidisphaera sp.]
MKHTNAMRGAHGARHAGLVVALAAVLSLAGMLGLGRDGENRDRWYILEMLGGKVGWMHSTVSNDGDKVISKSEMEFRLKRGGAEVSMAMKTEFVETGEGKPVSMRSVQKFGTLAIDNQYVFGPENVTLTSRQGDSVKTSKEPLPQGTWLPPAAAEKYVLQRMNSGAKEIVVRTIDPSNGLAIATATRSKIEPAKLMVGGREVEVTKSSVAVSLLPGVDSTEYTDNEGELVRSETALAGMPVILNVATEAEAKALAAQAAPEVMVSTFIKPSRAIPNARISRRGVYVLKMDKGDLPPIPETGSQRVEKLDAGSARVTVSTGGEADAPEADWNDAKYLAATSMCNASDAKVKELTQKALANAPKGERQRAEALRRFVHSYIKDKDLDVGFASASEVARNAEGDCTEHGVLLAGMLRAAGIRARVASGLIYADAFAGGTNIFGYHMWAQALVEENGKRHWVDLDATFPDIRPFDATHIALGYSALEDGDPVAGMSSLASLLGRLSVKVEKVD